MIDPKHWRANSKASDERYTPKWVFDWLDLEFDCDVAAPIQGPLYTPCKTWFHQELNGLDKQWSGIIFMNPPYSKPTPWIDKFLEHGNGIALMPTSIGKWFLRVWHHPQTKMTPVPPIKFVGGQKPSKTPAPFRCWIIGMGDAAHDAVTRFEKKTGEAL